ncbi:uncharacterized protein LOC127742849 [Arachis duranensis]|uniref:Uncharacterized protein LOC127742849 n=1 Tax=Arachis duranensis TaxID=130453 RepID=A0A9C6TMR5_ARADU|nr:uncharacterized protein LOC127742849 [Arachis duranensis]
MRLWTPTMMALKFFRPMMKVSPQVVIVSPLLHALFVPRKVRPAPQTSTNSIQNSLTGHLNLDANANEEPLVEEEVDELHDAPVVQSRRGRKTTEFWTVKIINSEGTIKRAKLSVRDAMARPNGRKIMLRFNNAKQAVGDEAGLLSGVLGLLGSDYGKFPICRKSWHQITTKDKIYNECVKSEEQGRIVGRGELWIKVHKKKDGSYMNDEARAIGVSSTC